MANSSQANNQGSRGNGLASRVRERTNAAQVAQARRDSASRPKAGAKKRRIKDSASLENGSGRTAEVMALRAVFRDFGKLHREYRERTGEGVSADLRAAALAFKENPNFQSLVVVAEFLDELDLL